jgi:hypothetical protein
MATPFPEIDIPETLEEPEI